MSFDDYVHHMKQKYRLAVAIAVIKNKPMDLTTDEYIAKLREKLKSQDEMEIDDLNISLCSEDFDLTEETTTDSTQDNASLHPPQCSDRKTNESPTILQDYDFNDFIKGNQTEKSNSFGETLEFLKEIGTEMPATSKEVASLNYFDLEQVQTTGLNEKVINETQNSNFPSQNPLSSTQDNVNNSIATDMQNTQTAYFEAQNNFAEPNQKETFDKNYQNIENLTDNQETQLPDFTEENTHVSQSQNIDTRFALLEKYVLGVKKPKNPTENDTKVRYTYKTNFINEAGSNCNDLNNCDRNFEIISLLDLNVNIVHENRKSYRDIEGKDIDKQTKESEHIIQLSNTDNTEKDDGPTQTAIANSLDIVNSMEEETFDSQAEPVIPFKIIEELNRIKSTLNRETRRRISTDGYSTDSGYRSDSQSKFSYRSGLQSQSQLLNQSGHSLFNYLLTSPLVPNTMDITNEISEVLGDLVDKLHNEENYPQFIDEILENIKILLEEICNSDTDGLTETMKKDESVHRLLLLNRSFHIITYTIEKIATNLEIFHSNLTTATDLYETTNIIHMENICHIFHALELLLQRYAKKKQIISSQPTPQTFEGDKTPIRSSIADIWKRKWDPEYKKKETTANISENKCTNLKIGEILNRIVVDCMDGYSLISFAALQCFNLMQS